MEIGVDHGRIVLKLQRDEDFLPSLVKALEESRVSSGLVLGGIGALKEFELGWFDPESRTYVRSGYEPSHELLSLQGTVTPGSEPPIHVHCSLSNEKCGVVGGHLFRGKVSVLAEVAIQGLEGIRLDREVNPRTGLRELTIRGP
ncbi:MAG: PPC domain-containing DNA-binding protein [Thermoplasmata archaeon]